MFHSSSTSKVNKPREINGGKGKKEMIKKRRTTFINLIRDNYSIKIHKKMSGLEHQRSIIKWIIKWLFKGYESYLKSEIDSIMIESPVR